MLYKPQRWLLGSFPSYGGRLGQEAGSEADPAPSMGSLTTSVSSLHFRPVAPPIKMIPALKLLRVCSGSYSMFIQTAIAGGLCTPRVGWSMDDDGEESGSDPEWWGKASGYKPGHEWWSALLWWLRWGSASHTGWKHGPKAWTVQVHQSIYGITECSVRKGYWSLLGMLLP